MNKKTVVTLFLIIGLIFILSIFEHAQAGSSQELLKQYIASLQNNPNDYSLREKIIKLVQQIKPQPAVPAEAKKYMARGMAAVEVAKSDRDFKDVISEFEKAVNAAPWLGEGYRNLGIAQYQTGQYDAAIKNLNLYLLTNPADVENAQSLIYKIEFLKEKAQKEAATKNQEREKKQSEVRRFRENLNGGWIQNTGNLYSYSVTVSGTQIEIVLAGINWGQGWNTPANQSRYRGTINDMEITGTYNIEDTSNGVGYRGNGSVQRGPFSGHISTDGREIVLKHEIMGKSDSGWWRYPTVVTLKKSN